MVTTGQITPGLRLVLCLVCVSLLWAAPACSFSPSYAAGGASPTSKVATTIDAEWIRDFHFTPDGGLLINNGTHLRLVDLATKTTRWVAAVGEGCCGDQVVTKRVAAIATGRGEAVYVLDMETGKLRYRLPADGQVFYSLAISPNQRLLATGENARIRLWDASSGTLLKTWPTGDEGFPNFPWTGGVTNLAFPAVGEQLFSANWWSGKVMLWDLSSDTIRSSFVLTSVVRYAFNPQADQLLVDFNQYGFEIRDPRSGHLLADHNKMIGAAGFVNFSRDGKKVVVWGGSAASVWELADDRLVQEFRNGDGPGWRYAAFDPQGDTLALCDEDGREIIFFDVVTGNRIDRLPMP